MSNNKQKVTFIAVVTGVVIVIVASARYAYVASLDPYKYIKFKKLAVPSATFPGRLDHGDYGFFSNMRVAQFSTQKKGYFNRDEIVLDDGTVIKMSSALA